MCQKNGAIITRAERVRKTCCRPSYRAARTTGTTWCCSDLVTRLDRPDDALKFYEAASTSAVPHLDLERDIEWGIQQAKADLNGQGATEFCSRAH